MWSFLQPLLPYFGRGEGAEEGEGPVDGDGDGKVGEGNELGRGPVGVPDHGEVLGDAEVLVELHEARVDVPVADPDGGACGAHLEGPVPVLPGRRHLAYTHSPRSLLDEHREGQGHQ